MFHYKTSFFLFFLTFFACEKLENTSNSLSTYGKQTEKNTKDIPPLKRIKKIHVNQKTKDGVREKIFDYLFLFEKNKLKSITNKAYNEDGSEKFDENKKIIFKYNPKSKNFTISNHNDYQFEYHPSSKSLSQEKIIYDKTTDFVGQIYVFEHGNRALHENHNSLSVNSEFQFRVKIPKEKKKNDILYSFDFDGNLITEDLEHMHCRSKDDMKIQSLLFEKEEKDGLPSISPLLQLSPLHLFALNTFTYGISSNKIENFEKVHLFCLKQNSIYQKQVYKIRDTEDVKFHYEIDFEILEEEDCYPKSVIIKHVNGTQKEVTKIYEYTFEYETILK